MDIYSCHDFLDYVRHPSAAVILDDITRFIDSSFSSTPGDSDRDGEVVQEFVRNMETAFRVHPLWSDCSEDELESVGEGLEKYVMERLFGRVFRSLAGEASRDSHISNKIDSLRRFFRPEHLDIDPATFGNDYAFRFAQTELKAMNLYMAPAGKLACILRCCKAINTLLLNQSPGGEFSADEFLPVLIYVTIMANPPNLHSNLSYIQRFRGELRLVSEPAYFFISMLSAENFIANMDAKSLSMDAAEFENHMKLSGDSGSADKKLKGVDSSTNPRNKDEVLRKTASIADLEGKDDSEKGQHRPFLNTKAADLTVANVEDLLHRYKKLVFKFVCLCQGLESSDPLD